MTAAMNMGSHAYLFNNESRASPFKISAGSRPLALLTIIALHVVALIYVVFFSGAPVLTPPEPIVMTSLISQPAIDKPITKLVSPIAIPNPTPVVRPLVKPLAKPEFKPVVEPVIKQRPMPPIVAVEKAPAPTTSEKVEPRANQVAVATPSPAPAPAPAPDPAPAPVVVPVEAAPAPVLPPRFNAAYLNNPPPAYPASARRMGEEGKVLLRVYVTAEGTAGEVRIQNSSGSPLFDDAATAAVRQWRFVPARQGENAVAAWVQVPIVFKLS
jgi:protein TonB